MCPLMQQISLFRRDFKTAWGRQFNITTLTPIVGTTPMPRSHAAIVVHYKISNAKISLSFIHLQVPSRGCHDAPYSPRCLFPILHPAPAI